MASTGSVKTQTQRPAGPKPGATKAVARALLGQAMGFRDCLPETLDALVAAAHLRPLGKGEALARRGAPFGMLCLIVQGSLEASMLRSDGHRHLMSFLQPGDLAGLIGFLDGMGHVHDLSARSADTCVLMIPRDALLAGRASDPALVRAFEMQLAFRSRLIYERLASDPSLPLVSRLARLLQTLSGLYGLPRPEGVQLEMKISQADLGDWLGVTRQRINFVIQQLEADGLIHLRYSTITVIDPAGLAERARL